MSGGGCFILFGWIIYGVAGGVRCLRFLAPPGPAAWVMRVRTRSPTFSLYREEGIPNKLGCSRENLAGGRRAWSLAPSWCACAPISIRSAALRARLHELGSLRMKRVGIAERTFRCVGETVFGWDNFVWVMRSFGGKGERVGSRREESNTFRIFVKMGLRGFASLVAHRPRLTNQEK